MELETVVGAYARVAELYASLLGSVEQVHRDDLALVERHLGHLRGPVLDVGCGPGHWTEHLRSLGVDASGVDPVPPFVEHARATHPLGRYDVGALPDPGPRDGSQAGVLAWYSLIHVEPAGLEPALAALRRLLRPGGTLVLGFFDGERVEPFEHRVVRAHRWPVDEVSRRLAAAGLVEVERARRPAEEGHRPHAAVVARAA
ncbi:class I SAM-dependent methyltransferase [Vallicoccus soli]|uniref:Class I SAM-dependent methyltransferase n=1 Tax=Vallicoccus soli TaxID=2339232 RepID=A0A3A3ZHN7_9ACTN|nr:class I SAM-dependent methyltransferase [Vallicoccus soli]RJK94860.1 class I SAM-dependent methyltransferase [Vallicoccus soli]